MKMQSIKIRSLLASARDSLRGLPEYHIAGQGNPAVRGLSFDSRNTREGHLFFALPGIHADGCRFVGAALKAGAVAIAAPEDAESRCSAEDWQILQKALAEGKAVLITTESPRRIMSPLASAFYGHPGREMPLAGVTGTDGKSSTVSYIHQLLSLTGEPAGFLSTVAYQAGGPVKKNPFRQSTPEAPLVHGFLREMQEGGCRCAVIEATSHGLSPRNSRLRDVPFQGAVLTNVTQEHLEFHGTLEQYRRDKAELFRAVDAHPQGFAVVNRDDPHHSLFEAAAGQARVVTYGIEEEPGPAGDPLDLTASQLKEGPQGTTFNLRSRGGGEWRITIPLPGRFNVENAMAAVLAAALLMQKPLAETVSRLPDLRGVPGRMELVRGNQPFTVLVDYAHTPGSFEKILPAVKEQCRGRLILVFGSAGERDREKRPKQGALADQYGDIVVLTDEDPRLEDSRIILEEIARGCPRRTRREDLFLIPDRREALEEAVKMARPGDTLAALGKGHEGSIIYADGPRDWLESRVLKEILRRQGWQVEE